MATKYSAVTRAFDRLAYLYDDRYASRRNSLMGWLRAESLRVFRKAVPAGGWVLEIGCGTGEETLALARSGYRVLALDIAPEMVRRARQKAAAAGLTGRTEFLALPAGRLAALGPAPLFDGAYAGFGALNCEPDLESLGFALGRLLRPGAAFVASVISRRCLFETLWLLAHGRLKQALAGRGSGWTVATLPSVGDGPPAVPMRPLSAAALGRALGPAFRTEAWLALPLMLPPAYMTGVFCRHRALFEKLLGLERMLRSRRPWRDWGDHTLVILRRL
ncbi:MAG: hypothetical protein C4315_08305 [Chloroflexota bacterium]